MDFCETRGGRRRLIRDNEHVFAHSRQLSTGVDVWVCILQRKNACRSWIKVYNGRIVQEQPQHSHPPKTHDLSNQILKLRQFAQERGDSRSETYSTTTHSGVSHLPADFGMRREMTDPDLYNKGRPLASTGGRNFSNSDATPPTFTRSDSVPNLSRVGGEGEGGGGNGFHGYVRGCEKCNSIMKKSQEALHMSEACGGSNGEGGRNLYSKQNNQSSYNNKTDTTIRNNVVGGNDKSAFEMTPSYFAGNRRPPLEKTRNTGETNASLRSAVNFDGDNVNGKPPRYTPMKDQSAQRSSQYVPPSSKDVHEQLKYPSFTTTTDSTTSDLSRISNQYIPKSMLATSRFIPKDIDGDSRDSSQYILNDPYASGRAADDLSRGSVRSFTSTDEGSVRSASTYSSGKSSSGSSTPVRKTSNNMPDPATPSTRADIPELPLQYKTTRSGDRFLITDQGAEGPNRMLIFATEKALQCLRLSPQWFCDGSFDVSSAFCFDVFVVHAVCGGTVLPCLYAMLPNRNRRTYDRLFQEVSKSVEGNHPTQVVCDLSVGAVEAMREVLGPGVDIKVSHFHLCAAVWRKVREAGLKHMYDHDHRFAGFVRMLAAVAFVPVHEVAEVFERLETTVRDNYQETAVDNLLDYFEDMFVGRYRRGRSRAPPTISIDMWNMKSRCTKEIMKNNSEMEKWHRKFQKSCRIPLPTFWKLLQVIQEEESSYHLAVEKVI